MSTVGLSLRQATVSDVSILFTWANDPVVRSNSFNSSDIPLEDHQSWFNAGLSDSRRLHYIAIDNFNCPVGQIRFDLRTADNLAEIDFSLCPSKRGLRLGHLLLLQGLKSMHEKWGSHVIAYGDVLVNNLASNKSFQKAGFSLVSPSSGNQAVNRWIFNPTSSSSCQFC